MHNQIQQDEISREPNRFDSDLVDCILKEECQIFAAHLVKLVKHLFFRE